MIKNLRLRIIYLLTFQNDINALRHFLSIAQKVKFLKLLQLNEFTGVFLNYFIKSIYKESMHYDFIIQIT